MALTIGEHLFKRLNPSTSEVYMNVSNVEVLESQIPHNNSSVNAKPQLIQVEGNIDLAEPSTAIAWYTLSADGGRSDHAFASATVYYERASDWKAQWRKSTHFVTDRIMSLSSLAATGVANRLSRSMIYQLFQNVVDYADRYQGMQSVILHGLEAFSEVELVADRHGSWHTPPHWIDSVFQMAGFVMNGSDITNTREYFYITPGWEALRLVKPLEASQRYQSYVRMFPSEEEPNVFLGDIYALQAGEIVGVCEGIKFRKIPRVLMAHLFSGGPKASYSPKSASEKKSSANSQSNGPTKSSKSIHTLHKPVAGRASEPPQSSPINKTAPKPSPVPPPEQISKVTPPLDVSTPRQDSGEKQMPEVVVNCLALVARETGISVTDFTDDASFNEMGIDSLMSLVLSEKMLREIGVEVKSSTFLECPTVGEFTEWLTQYH
jgi:asperthecin polyketide synthase